MASFAAFVQLRSQVGDSLETLLPLLDSFRFSFSDAQISATHLMKVLLLTGRESDEKRCDVSGVSILVKQATGKFTVGAVSAVGGLV